MLVQAWLVQAGTARCAIMCSGNSQLHNTHTLTYAILTPVPSVVPSKLKKQQKFGKKLFDFKIVIFLASLPQGHIS